MDERLPHLLRQRAAIAEHLAWLDQEIARARPVSATNPTSITPSADLSPPSPAAPEDSADPDRLLKQFQAESNDAGLPSKFGCWGGFLGGLIALIGIIASVIYLFYR